MRIGQFIDMIEKRLYTYKTQYILRKLIMLNDTNPMNGLPSHNGIDVMGNPNSTTNDDTNKNSSNSNINFSWGWKTDLFLITVAVAVNLYVFIN